MNGAAERKTGSVITSEKKTVRKMITFYCNKTHETAVGSLCSDCLGLLEYSNHRLDHCAFGETKPTCRKCEKHCYKPDMRQRIRDVMRFSGPRLAIRAPIDWVRHWVHERRS
ncbi:MAG: nitrous oxide-stimulated promoter family protein [Candidatus Hodarchaeota archaeon]